jgi:hypothetical protein
MTQDLTDLCRKYDERMQAKFPRNIWFFPRIDGKAPILKTTVDGMFAEIWEITHISKMVPKAPRVHSLRLAFGIEKMNTGMKEGVSETMFPYLMCTLVIPAFLRPIYYYHNKEPIFELIREKDGDSANIIPKVVEYEQ